MTEASRLIFSLFVFPTPSRQRTARQSYSEQRAMPERARYRSAAAPAIARRPRSPTFGPKRERQLHRTSGLVGK
jgi:hypothetical protein